MYHVAVLKNQTMPGRCAHVYRHGTVAWIPAGNGRVPHRHFCKGLTLLTQHLCHRHAPVHPTMALDHDLDTRSVLDGKLSANRVFDIRQKRQKPMVQDLFLDTCISAICTRLIEDSSVVGSYVDEDVTVPQFLILSSAADDHLSPFHIQNRLLPHGSTSGPAKAWDWDSGIPSARCSKGRASARDWATSRASTSRRCRTMGQPGPPRPSTKSRCWWFVCFRPPNSTFHSHATVLPLDCSENFWLDSMRRRLPRSFPLKWAWDRRQHLTGQVAFHKKKRCDPSYKRNQLSFRLYYSLFLKQSPHRGTTQRNALILRHPEA